MVAPVLVQSKVFEDSTPASPLNVVLDAPPTPGNLLHLVVVTRNVTSCRRVPTAPAFTAHSSSVATALVSGWQADPSLAGTKAHGFRTFHRFVQPGDTATITFGSDGTGGTAGVHIYVAEWSGLDTHEETHTDIETEAISHSTYPSVVYGAGPVTPRAGLAGLIIATSCPSLNINDTFTPFAINGAQDADSSGEGGGSMAKSWTAYKSGPSGIAVPTIINVESAPWSGVDRGRAYWTDVYSGPGPEEVPGDHQDVVDDDDAFVDTLLEITDKVIRIERQGWGSGAFRVRRDSADAVTVGTGLDGRMVKVTIPRISPDPIWRYAIETINVVLADEQEQGEELLAVAGRGALGAYLDRAVASPYTYVIPSGPVEVHRSPAATGTKAGQILRRALAELQHADRPQHPVPLITVDFDYTNDSDGNPWATTDMTDEMNLAYTGESALVGFQELWGTGGIDFHLEYDGSMLLRGFNYYGRDLSSSSFATGKVRFVKGVNIADRMERTIGTQLPATYMWVEGEEFVFLDPPAHLADATSRPVVESFIKTVGTDPTNLEAIADATLLEALRRGESVAFNVAIVASNDLLDEEAGLYLPGPPGSSGHFWVGDTVTLHTGTGQHDFNNESARIEAITLSFDEANNLRCKVEVKAVTIAGRLPPSTGTRGQLGGIVTGPGSTSGAGGTTQPPPPTSSDLQSHLADAVDAHDASAISIADAGANYASSNVEGALAEAMDAEQAHEADAVDAHDASAISFSPTGSIASTDVQAAIAEVAAEASAGASDGHGAMAIRYVFSTTTTDSDPGSGNARLSNATQSSAVTLRLDLTDADGVDVTAELDTISNWLSTTKGYVRIAHRTDPTKWLFGTVSAIASPSGYRNITIANVAKSATSPLSNSDPIVVEFLVGVLAHKASHDVGATDQLTTGTPSTQSFGDAASAGAGPGWAPINHKHGMPADPGGAGGSVEVQPFFGDGRDGDVTISADTTIARDMYYNNLTVNVGVNLDTALLRVFVKGTLTLNGTIRCNGNNGGAGGTGTAGAGGAAGTAGAQQTGGSVQNLPNGPIGRAGAVGGINANGSGTTAGGATTYFGIVNPAGAAGGVSGSGRSGGAGGAAGTGAETVQEKPLVWPALITWANLLGTQINMANVGGTPAQAGSGGGAAASGGGGSGGSGSGGGTVVVCARTITGSGTIQAKGGNGGAGGGGLAGAQAGGGAGGNGGPGGNAVLISKDSTGWSGAFDVAGGTHGNGGAAGGGAGSTGGGNGNDGPSGKSFQMKLG